MGDMTGKMQELATTTIPGNLNELLSKQQNIPGILEYCTGAYRTDNPNQRSQVFEQTKQYTEDALATVAQLVGTLSQDMTDFVQMQSYELEKMSVQVRSLTERMNNAQIAAGQRGLQTVLAQNPPDSKEACTRTIPPDQLTGVAKPLPFYRYEKINLDQVKEADLATSIHRMPAQPQSADFVTGDGRTSMETRPTFADRDDTFLGTSLSNLPRTPSVYESITPRTARTDMSALPGAPPPLSSARGAPPPMSQGAPPPMSQGAPPPMSQGGPPPPMSQGGPPPPMSQGGPPPPMSQGGPPPPMSQGAPPPMSSYGAPPPPMSGGYGQPAPPPPQTAQPPPPPSMSQPPPPPAPGPFQPPESTPTPPPGSQAMMMDENRKTPAMSVSGNTFTQGGADQYCTILGKQPLRPRTGLHYYEIAVEQTAASMIFVGFWDASDVAFLENYSNSNSYTICLSSGETFRNTTQNPLLEYCFVVGDKLGLLYDSNDATIYAYVDGNFAGKAFEGVTGDLLPVMTFYNSGDSLAVTPQSFVSM